VSVNVLRGQPHVGEWALAVEADDEPRYLAVAEVKQSRSLPGHLRDLHPACLAAPAEVLEHENALVVKSPVFLYDTAELLFPRPQKVFPAMGHAGQPCPGSG